jgi:lysozyme
MANSPKDSVQPVARQRQAYESILGELRAVPKEQYSPGAYPIFPTAFRQFGSDNVMARVEWHPCTWRNGVKVAGQFRGVTLYEVIARLAPYVEGIDVSHYQNKIDWKQVATCKAFAFIKATEGTTVEDKQFASNWSAARDAGLLRDAYHFLHPSVDSMKQAEFFLSKVATCELPPVLDVEATDNVPSAKLVQCVKTWVEHVAARLRRPLIYASPSFWQKLPASDIEQEADLWIAEWECQHPCKMGAWPGWSFWQYTSRGAVPGIAGSVDLNRFNGTVDDLYAYLTRTSGGSVVDPRSFDLTTVIGVQRALNFLKIAEPPLIEDGVDGPKTKAAVREFQRDNGLEVDGVVGGNTRAKLTQIYVAAH